MPRKYKKYVCLFERPFKVTEYSIFFEDLASLFHAGFFSHIVRLDELVRRHEVHLTGVSSMFQEGLQLCIYLSLLNDLVKSRDTCIWYRSFKKENAILTHFERPLK